MHAHLQRPWLNKDVNHVFRKELFGSDDSVTWNILPCFLYPWFNAPNQAEPAQDRRSDSPCGFLSFRWFNC